MYTTRSGDEKLGLSGWNTIARAWYKNTLPYLLLVPEEVFNRLTKKNKIIIFLSVTQHLVAGYC